MRPHLHGGWGGGEVDTNCSIFEVISQLVAVTGEPQWDVDRLIRARNPGAVFTTTERVDVTWQTLRSITYSPTLQQGAVGSASVQEASLVRRSVECLDSITPQCYNLSLHFSFKNPDSKSGCSQSVVSAYLCVWMVSLSLWIRIRRLYRYMEISFPGWSQGKCNTKTPGTQEVTRGRRKMKWLGWVMTEHLPQCRLNCEQTIQVKNQIICDMCTCILIHHCIK